MNKKILAISISAVLVISLLMPAGMNAQARKAGTDANILSQITRGLNQLVSGVSTVENNVDTIREDLKIKKKFFVEFLGQPGFGVEGGKTNDVTLTATGCPADLPTRLQLEKDQTVPCAFSLESLQIGAFVNPSTATEICHVSSIIVDGVESELSHTIDVTNVTKNILIEASIPLIGASHSIVVPVSCANSAFIFAEFNGERPQITEFETSNVFF